MNNDSRYANGDDLANEQNCFYVIKQDDAYHPFRYLGDSNKPIENFKLSDKDSAYAVLFKLSFQRNGELKQVWAYQKIQPASNSEQAKKAFSVHYKIFGSSRYF